MVQGLTLLSMIDASGLVSLRGPQVQRFVEEATLAARQHPRHPAEAGLATVDRPGAIAGPAKNVLWWPFTSVSVTPFNPPPLTISEKKGLAAAGIRLTGPRQILLDNARRWRRPLTFAQESLVLVCPERSDNGEDQHPHPLWDELISLTPSLKHVIKPKVLTPTPIPDHRPPAKRPPQPRREWQAPAGLITPREMESPSSLDAQVGCSVRWALRYSAQLYAGRSHRLNEGVGLQGNLCHDILRRVLLSSPASPEAARDKAREIFENTGPSLAGGLFLPGSDRARHETLRAVTEGAFHIQTLLDNGKLQVRAVEEFVKAESPIGLIGGRPDIVAEPPLTILDLKWGGASYRRRELRSGAAAQLATYAFLTKAKPTDPWPAVAFYILTGSHLLSNDTRVPQAETHPGPAINKTWEALCSAVQARREELSQGKLVAPGNPNAEGELIEIEAHIEDEVLRLPPGCRFCDFKPLCGQLFIETALPTA